MRNKIYQQNVLQTPWPLADKSVDVVIVSPPYWGLRDYLHPDQIGQEPTPEQFIQHMVEVFREAWRVLKDSGTVWLNLADTYWGGKGQSGAGWSKENGGNLNANGINWAAKGQTRPQDRKHEVIKPKDLVGIPWAVAFALRAEGWYLRQDIIWQKPNPMPESVNDRCTKAHEYIFLLSKSRDYYYDHEAIKQPMVEYEMLRRIREKKEGLDSKYELARDSRTGLADQSQTGAIRNVKRRQELAETGMANKKSVWTVATKGFDAEFCTACRRYYAGKEKKLIRTEKVIEGGKEVKRNWCMCGRHDAWVAHFATFPEELIVDCVRASTSQKGNCATCGEPWERITEEVEEVGHTGESETAYAADMSAGRLASLRQAAREAGGEYEKKTRTIGWQPTCSCGDQNVVKPIVLDFFFGGGTSGIVAMAQGRDFVGLELNPDYIDLAKHRLRHQFGAFFQL